MESHGFLCHLGIITFAIGKVIARAQLFFAAVFFHGCEKSCKRRPGYEAKEIRLPRYAHIGRGNQFFKGDHLFHTKVELFVPGGANISGIQILCDTIQEVKKVYILGGINAQIDCV